MTGNAGRSPQPTGRTSATPTRQPSVTSRFTRMFTSEAGIYGLIVVSGVIVVSRNLTGTSAEALFAVIVTLVVFFAAHSYAATLAWLADQEHEDQSFAEAVRHGIAESTSLLLVGLVPVAVLSLGVLGVLRPADAVWLALAVDVVLLGLLGWGITAARVRGVWSRLGGALITAAFGIVIIALKALIH